MQEDIITEDGKTVHKGDRVFNYYDAQWVTIIEDPDSEGWFSVIDDKGVRKTLNGARIATFEPEWMKQARLKREAKKNG